MSEWSISCVCAYNKKVCVVLFYFVCVSVSAVYELCRGVSDVSRCVRCVQMCQMCPDVSDVSRCVRCVQMCLSGVSVVCQWCEWCVIKKGV
jgi:hypothetical protein